MNADISNFLYGAVGGGMVATGMRITETYLISPRFSESIEARKKLFVYARPLSYACHELEYRLSAVLDEIHGKVAADSALRFSPKQAESIDWFTEGYYVTSPAYLIASVSSWIQLYERDVVFLKFGRLSLTRQFFILIEQFKSSFSNRGSILWFYYVNGIGEQLVDRDNNRPMTMTDFIYKLHEDELFRSYYDQLFTFLNQVSEGRYLDNIQDVIQQANEIKRFLVENRVTISMYGS